MGSECSQLAKTRDGPRITVGHACSIRLQLSRHRTPEGDFDLGDLVMAALGLDRRWMQRASCRKWLRAEEDPKPTPWQVDRDDVVDGIRGHELITMALMVCYSCTAQYDCAAYAVDGQMRAGTWSMGIGDLRWLQKQPGPLLMIEEARQQQQPVQVVVGGLRSAATRSRA